VHGGTGNLLHDDEIISYVTWMMTSEWPRTRRDVPAGHSDGRTDGRTRRPIHVGLQRGTERDRGGAQRLFTPRVN